MAEIVVVACPPWEGELAELLGPAPDEDPEDRQLEFSFTPDMTPSG